MSQLSLISAVIQYSLLKLHTRVLQVKQKHESMEAEKDRFGAAGSDKDSIRDAILEQAVIVCEFYFVLIKM